ncbi:multiheme c-type cytochrome [Methyloprofundus sp.]|uniref:multiheme c-type cytochrome n=1 Tax=Methyloprofundus sp. TaxID=2020875 RepID=UPI003D0D7EE5
MRKYSVLITLIIAFVSPCWADATFTTEQNQLHIPYLRFQEQYYQANLSFLPPDKLKLEEIASQLELVPPAEIVPVYSDLSLHLSRIELDGQQYAADMHYLGENIFQIHNLSSSIIASRGRTIFRSKHFSGSGICAQCHNGIKDDQGNDVSIVSAWETSMMANATRDPFWQAKIRSELNRTPNQQDFINDTCTRCHAPMANEQARKQGDSIQQVFGAGFLNRTNPYHNLAMNGVSCSLCHQISPNEPFGTEASFSGNFVIDTYPTSTERLIYGPFENVLTSPMQNFANFTPVYSEHIKSSELCASCHDLTTPYTDAQGNILSSSTADEFPEQMPYSEWLHSDYVATDSCQQCHMPRANGVVIASQPNGLKTQRDDFAQHSFLGSNRLMLSILQDYREVLGVVPEDFSTSLLNAEQLLSEAALLEVNNVSVDNAQLKFNLKINSLTGHKLPSGYPSRRVIVHVLVRDKQGNIVFETGKVNADGSVVELDSDRNAGFYEPHYDVIESAEQVQVYEAVMQDHEDNITYTLLRAKSYIKDNRLLPKGFDKQTVPNKIQVQGLAAEDKDFIGGSDTLRFALKNMPGQEYSIEAELIYQTLGYAFAQDLFSDQAIEVSRFKQMFNASSLKSTSINKVNYITLRN